MIVVDLSHGRLDAFAANPTNVCRTHHVTHNIYIGNNVLLNERVRLVPRSWREFINQELNKLMLIGEISEADPGECSFA